MNQFERQLLEDRVRQIQRENEEHKIHMALQVGIALGKVATRKPKRK